MKPTCTNDVIEQQLFKLMRRANAIHVTTASGEVELERSSYGILCLLADEGPQRLGSVAAAFRLDPSTVTRQAQAVVRLGLADKSVDADDRRATVLSLTPAGMESIDAAREHRRKTLDLWLSAWSDSELDTFATLLGNFNDTILRWEDGALPTAAQ